jgi:hypothetical protein
MGDAPKLAADHIGENTLSRIRLFVGSLLLLVNREISEGVAFLIALGGTVLLKRDSSQAVFSDYSELMEGLSGANYVERWTKTLPLVNTSKLKNHRSKTMEDGLGI